MCDKEFLWGILNTQFASSVIGSLIGASAAILCAWTTMRDSAQQIQVKFEQERKSREIDDLEMLKVEILDNMELLKKPMSMMRLSDDMWRQSRKTLHKINPEVFPDCSDAYRKVGYLMGIIEHRKIAGSGTDIMTMGLKAEQDLLTKALAHVENTVSKAKEAL